MKIIFSIIIFSLLWIWFFNSEIFITSLESFKLIFTHVKEWFVFVPLEVRGVLFLIIALIIYEIARSYFKTNN
jgi:hypothetical protein